MKITSPHKALSWLLPFVLTGCLSSPEYADDATDQNANPGGNNDVSLDEGKISGIQDSYDEAVVTLGKSVYEAQCEACHGDETQAGQYGPMFVEGSVLKTNEAYVNYIRDFMPIAQTQACGQACAEAVMAYGVTHLLSEDQKPSDDQGNDDQNTDSGNNTDDNNQGSDDQNTGDNSNDNNQDSGLVTKQQAGEALYGEQCASCHGDDGLGGFFPAFFAEGSNLTNDTDMITYIADAMPVGDEQACDTDCADKILAYAKVTFEGSYDTGSDTGNDNGSDSGNDSGNDNNQPTAPSMPTGVTAAANASQDLINIFWNDESNDETGFEIQRSVNGGAWGTIALTNSDSVIYVDMAVVVEGSYQYRVRSVKSDLASVWVASNPITIQKEEPVAKPSAPSALNAEIVAKGVDLTWNDNANDEDGFKVERRTSGGSWAQIASLAMNVEGYSNMSVIAGTSYEYRVKAFNTAGDSAWVTVTNVVIPQEDNSSNCDGVPQYSAGTAYQSGQKVQNSEKVYECKIGGWCSSNSALHYEPGIGLNWADAWTLTAESCEGGNNNVVLPSAVSSVVASANAGNASISVVWVDSADNETGFKIQRKENTGNWLTIAEVGANVVTYMDAQVDAGNSYQYRIASFNSQGDATWVSSAPLNLEVEQTLPIAATNIQATNDNDNAVVIAFADRSDNEVGFKLERKANAGSWTLLITLNENVTSYRDESVQGGNTYQYRVAPFNGAGTASYVTSTSVNVAEQISANQTAFESACSGCHTPNGGIGGNLFDGFTKNRWAGEEFVTFMDKVDSMPVSGCDAECKENAADYVWLEAWGLTKQVVVVANGRGVRGVRLMAPYEYQNAIKDLTGVSLSDDELPKQFFDTTFKYPTQGDTGVVLYEGLQKFLSLAEKVSQTASLNLIGCSSSTCSDSQVSTAGLRVLRRPLNSTELASYRSINSAHGAREMLTAMLVSPYFLYKMELGNWNSAESAYELNNYEMASSLAFMLWGTVPDSNLLSVAAANGLDTDQKVQAQVEIMMNDARFKENMAKFMKYYTHSYGVATEKPGLTQSVINSMYGEQEAFVEYWLGDDASFNSLFNPGYTFVDSALANHYGISASQSSMHKVNTGSNRGGVLHQGLTQIMNSDHQATSLVKRGKMIRENIMCHTMGVPSGVDPATITLPDTPISTRERWDIITGPNASAGQCWECHQLMNEPGSALERFDQTGKYRTTEQDYNGSVTQLIVEVAGTLRDNSADPLTQYEDARELAAHLGQSDIAKECFAESIVQFGLGHKEDAYNREEMGGIKANFNQADNVKDLIKAVASSSMFRYRVNRD